VARVAVADTELGGCPIKAGQNVMVVLAGANTDEAELPDSMEVRFDRDVNRHLAFGGGLHRCLGSHLARLELRTAIDQLHRRLSDYWVTPGAQIEYQHEGVRAAVRLPLQFTAR
jgi:cytochrome P450